MKRDKAPYPKFILYIAAIGGIFAMLAVISAFVLDPVQYAAWFKLLTWTFILAMPVLIIVAFYVQAGEALKEAPWKAVLGLIIAVASAILAFGDIFSLIENEVATPQPYELTLTQLGTLSRLINTTSVATAEARISQTQQVYISSSTDAVVNKGTGTPMPLSNLAPTLAAVETEVSVFMTAEFRETLQAYRTQYMRETATPTPQSP